MEEGINAGFLLLGLGICLALSAFFSSAETAFFSLTQSQLAELKESKEVGARRVVRLLERPKQLLITILAGNALVNVVMAVISAYFAIELCHATGFPVSFGLAFEVIIVTGVILILGEITPKIVALKHARRWALGTGLPIEITRRLMLPLTLMLNLISGGVSSALGVERRRLGISEDEIKALVEISEDRGALEEDEKEMIEGIFAISETTVKEIMTPRVDIASLSITASIQDVIQLVKDEGHSRIPIYNGNLDNIAGLIHVKDLLPYLRSGSTQVDLTKIIRQAHFVPEGKKIDDLLRQFQGERFHMAIAVDEYGGTAGLVTLEDILEEIVGEIQDEYDSEMPLYQQIDDHTYLADARINIEELNELLGDDVIPEAEDYETLGGFVYHQTGHLLKQKEVIDFGNLHLIIEELVGKHVSKIRIEKRPPISETASE
ncbi:MAG: hemolysin family protein [bacterium]|nr:hemolysin family protein [bacterium]